MNDPVRVTVCEPDTPASCPRCKRLVLVAYDPIAGELAYDPPRSLELVVRARLGDRGATGQSVAPGDGADHCCPAPASAARVRAIAAQILATSDGPDQSRLFYRLAVGLAPADVDRVFDALVDAGADWCLPVGAEGGAA